MPSPVSLTICWWLWSSLCSVCQVCRKIIFCSFGMFEFSLRSTLFCFSFNSSDIVDSPILVFFPIVPCQFEQVLPNLSSFDQSIVSSSLRKLVKPKKLEKHSGSFFWKLIFKPGRVLVVFFCASKNKQYIYTHVDVIIYRDVKLFVAF